MTPEQEREEIWRHALEAQADGKITESQLQDVRDILMDAALDSELRNFDICEVAKAEIEMAQ